MTTEAKTMMGTYELVRRLGVGGMGEVWLARQRGAAGFARDVAIKRLLPQAMEQPDVVQMFIEEAQVTGRLRHPNVVNVIELGAAESGELYLVLEHVDGTGLHKMLRDPGTRPGVAATLVLGRDVALALHAAHELNDEEGNELGLVHRDVTPSNVMVDRYGHVKLMDFGIAKVRAKQNTTEAGIIKGKIAYLAPEQLRGEVDGRSDLFALGLVLWEIVAGHQARSGSSDAAMMARVALDAVPSIKTVAPDLPEAVAAAIDKACALDPNDRYQTGQEMAAALLAALDALPDRPRIESAREDLARMVKQTTKREGDVDGGTTKGSATVNPENRLAITIHSLVVQQGDLTISRQFDPKMIKAPQAPPDARPVTSVGTGTGFTRGGRARGSRKRSSSALPIVAILAAVGMLGVVAVRRSQARSTPVSPGNPSTTPSSVGTPPPLGVAAAPPQNLVEAHPPPVAPPPVAPPAGLADAGATAPTTNNGGTSTAVGANARPNNTRPNNRNTRVGAPAQTTAAAPVGGDGRLLIAVTPWGNVAVDGRDYGATPIGAITLAAGRHSVRVTNPDRQYTRTFTVDILAGETRRVREEVR